MLWRNNLVYNYRISVIRDTRFTDEENIKRYYRLPSYNEMLFQILKLDWEDVLTTTEEK